MEAEVTRRTHPQAGTSQYFANINKHRRQYLAKDHQYNYIFGGYINKRRGEYYSRA